MKRLLLVLIVLLAACLPVATPVVTAPTTESRTVALHLGVSSCAVALAQNGARVGATASDATGTAAFIVTMQYDGGQPAPGTLNLATTATCVGYQPYAASWMAAVHGNQDVCAGGTSCGPNQGIVLSPLVSTAWHPTRAQVLDVRMNFGSYQFDDGTPILEWLEPNFTAAQQAQLFDRIAQHGDTHVMLAVHASYRPTYPVPQSTLTPQQLHDAIVDMRDQHHLIPWVMLSSGDGGTGTDPDRVWPAYMAALGDVKNDAIWCLGFEVGANAGWTSAQILHGVHVLRQWLGPAGVIAYEPIPERFTGSSHPVERDDPSNGDEVGWWRLPDAQQIDLFAYETSHGSKLMEQPCAVSDGGCWLNRWQEGVQRLGAGGRGWPKKPLVLLETNTMDCYNDHAQCAAYGRLTAAGLKVCTDNGIRCGYGSGAPQ